MSRTPATIHTANLGDGVTAYADSVHGRMQIDGKPARVMYFFDVFRQLYDHSPAVVPRVRYERPNLFWDWLEQRLDAWASRDGRRVMRVSGATQQPYLSRYRLLQFGQWAAVYVHHFHRGDVDPDPHDHPFPFLTFVLAGGYHEETARNGLKWLPAGRAAYRPATWRHRVVITHDRQVWTLVVRGPRVRDWGFWTRCGFCPWRTYVDNGGAVCEEPT